MQEDADSTPWRAFFEEAQQRCAAAGLESPEIDARRMVEEAAGFAPAEFRLRLDDAASVRGVAHFDAMITRRLSGEPLQYVVGRWGFRTLDLMVDKRALIPRPETEIVAGLALAELRRHAGTETLLAADLGTGTGAIGLSLLVECKEVSVWLTDASEEALALAAANLSGLGRPGARGSIKAGSWFDALPAEHKGRFHLIASNPPYVAVDDPLPEVVRDWEPADALFAGSDGLDAARCLITESLDWLVPGGSLVLELGDTQLDVAAELADLAGFEDVAVHPDLSGRDRALVARRPK